MLEKLPSGNVRAIIYISTLKGERTRITRTFKSRKEAKIWHAQKTMDKAKGLLNGVKSHLEESATFLALSKEYLKSVSVSRSPNTIISYRNQLSKHVFDEIGMMKMYTIKPFHIKNLQSYLVTKELSNKHINQVLKIVRSVFNYAIKGVPQLDLKDPTIPIESLKVQKKLKRRKYMSEKEIGVLIKSLKGNHYKDIIVFLLNHGTRISETSALRVSDFNAKEKSLSIEGQLHPYLPVLNEPALKQAFVLGNLKTCEPRKIYLNETSLEIIKRNIVGKSSRDFIFKPKRKYASNLKTIILKRGANPKIIKTHLVNPRSHGFNKEVFKPILEKAGIDRDFTVHNLRDTFATHFYMKTKDLYALKKTLGHLSITSTQVYVDIFEDSERAYADVHEVSYD